MTVSKYSTAQVAKKLGITKMTLLRWMKLGYIPKAELVTQIGGVPAWLWSHEHIRAAMRVQQDPTHPAHSRGPKAKAGRPAKRES